jgi:molybdopterin-guanine dinucleotide biosynthesis protein A
MKIAAVIIAGGASSRMGAEKALTILRGKPILQHILDRIAPQTMLLAINANGDQGRFKTFGITVIPDRKRELGTPLAGLHAALWFARETGADAVFTVPSDTPFLPRDLVSRLGEAQSPAAVASSNGQKHYLTGLWSQGLVEDIEAAIDLDRLVRVRDWAMRTGAASVDWPTQPFDPFFNVNTPADLAEAERLAAEFNP